MKNFQFFDVFRFQYNKLVIANPFLSAKAISEKISEKISENFKVTDRTIESDLAQFKKMGILTRKSGRKE